MVLGQPGGASRNLVPKGSVRNMLVPQPPAAAKPRGRIPGGRGAELDRAGAGASPRGDEEVDLGNEFLDFPLLDTLSKINAQVGGLRNQLAKTDHHVTAALLPPDEDDEEAVAQPQVARQDTAQSIEPDGTFLTGVDFVEKVRTPGEVDEAMRKELIEAKSVEALPWPGVGKQPHDLPGNLNSLDVLKRLGDMVQFPRKQDQRMWEELLGSKQSEAMTKDLFWWFYCDKFGSGEHAAEQEKMFGRMASNFVGLLTKVPHEAKDRFFESFYNVIAEGVFVAYKVGLPESDAAFDRNFRGELARTFGYWTTGADIGPIEYVLQNGQLVRADPALDGVLRVVHAIRAEQDELDQMVAVKKSKNSSLATRQRSAPGVLRVQPGARQAVEWRAPPAVRDHSLGRRRAAGR
ncbi:hypothetical protein T484DRAFT_3044159 [Baffinella frigidus]|nr:hypothetical protein T484DRAFT_3044159 [Cryptophyta sp. CCMP2293]